jgi:hypothetical protein
MPYPFYALREPFSWNGFAAVSEVARPQSGWPAAVFYPSGHPTPYTSAERKQTQIEIKSRDFTWLHLTSPDVTRFTWILIGFEQRCGSGKVITYMKLTTFLDYKVKVRKILSWKLPILKT